MKVALRMIVALAVCSLGLVLAGCNTGDAPGSAKVSPQDSEQHIPGKTAPSSGPGGVGQPGVGAGRPPAGSPGAGR